ncbi:sterol desaturase family protein [Marinomonas rhizomae]|uniref:Sterol desaturase/sphingolipid hydroxylase (Fatty acid hydroxylase superfamily) n=1 Tax=Marinomonas rhizomae TaxID=491948 RepID=A0A366J3I1_9GAMM|nr:sterol desaturase family protein [Marinomonas rhizomae]RBP80508.1 sterol desaturase/sphingolipid hydroxylase (fatty acid hydroxylase superfamily) [Marinomonas rhizomae]RNF71745.1 sterol desaturase family protein [Marinomonas rhizomae]
MDWLTYVFTADDVFWLEEFIGDWFFVIAASLFIVEILRYAFKKQITKNLLGDSVANFVTLALFIAIVSLVGLAYLGIFFYVYEHFRVTDLPLTLWTIGCCIVLADLAYYWEHRFLHKNGFAWATHTVHHSSPYFNISVAYRFGPLDWLFPLFFHLPLALLGFHPFVILLAEMVVQVFQTLLHTEAVKKFPRPIEAVFNTPSHHRVHHATNSQYLDKNYAGIFIIWDRMFGTFAKEEETVTYGVFPRINSVNPFKIFFSGYVKLVQQLISAPSWSYRWKLLVKPPIWVWQQEQAVKKEQGKKREG